MGRDLCLAASVPAVSATVHTAPIVQWALTCWAASDHFFLPTHAFLISWIPELWLWLPFNFSSTVGPSAPFLGIASQNMLLLQVNSPARDISYSLWDKGSLWIPRMSHLVVGNGGHSLRSSVCLGMLSVVVFYHSHPRSARLVPPYYLTSPLTNLVPLLT